MISPALAFAAIAAALYLHAGHLTFQVLYLTATPAEREGELVWRAAQAGALPRRARLAWAVLWLPILALSWMLARRHAYVR